MLFVPALRGDEISREFRENTHLFRRILHDNNLKPLASPLELGTDPAHTLLVVLGKIDRGADLDRIGGIGLRAFLARGGAALIATDQTLQTRQLFEVCEFGVSGEPVAAWSPFWGQPRRLPEGLERYVYAGPDGPQPECLIVKPPTNLPAFLLHLQPDALAVPARLTTNRPSYLVSIRRHPSRRVKVLAVFPQGAWYTSAGRPQRVREELLPLAVSAETGPGRLLLLADHSVFINEMMGLLPGTDNAEFAYRAARWLKGSKDDPRTRVLFIEDGEVVTLLNVPLRDIRKTLAEVQAELTDQANALMARLQAEHARWNTVNDDVMDAFGGRGRGLFGGSGSENFYLLLVLLAALGITVYGFVCLWRASHQPEEFQPAFATALARARPAGSVLQQRHRLALQEDNLAEYARALAQEFLAAVPGLPEPGAETPARPGVAVEGSRSRQRALLGLFGAVWDLAYGESPGRVSRGRFLRLLSQIRQLRGALASGELRIV